MINNKSWPTQPLQCDPGTHKKRWRTKEEQLQQRIACPRLDSGRKKMRLPVERRGNLVQWRGQGWSGIRVSSKDIHRPTCFLLQVLRSSVLKPYIGKKKGDRHIRSATIQFDLPLSLHLPSGTVTQISEGFH